MSTPNTARKQNICEWKCGKTVPQPPRRLVPHAAFFFVDFSLAHRALCAAAIFFRAAADMTRFFLETATTLCLRLPFPLLSARTLAHRALCAAAIFARAAADNRLRPLRGCPLEAPFNADSAASSCATFFAAWSRSFFNC